MVSALPRIRYKGKEYFLDEEQMMLRRVSNPWKIIPIDDCDACIIKQTCHYVE